MKLYLVSDVAVDSNFPLYCRVTYTVIPLLKSWMAVVRSVHSVQLSLSDVTLCPW